MTKEDLEKGIDRILYYTPRDEMKKAIMDYLENVGLLNSNKHELQVSPPLFLGDKTQTEKSVCVKMKEQKIQNFSDEEFIRVFRNVIAPTVCIKVAKQLIEKGLTIEDVTG